MPGPFDFPTDFSALERKYKGKTTRPVDQSKMRVKVKPQQRKQPEIKVVPMPSVANTARSALSIAQNAPAALADLAVSAPKAAYNYVRTSTPSKVVADVKRGAGDLVDYVTENPAEAFVETVAGTPKAVGEMFREATLARDAGDVARAEQIEKFAVPMLLGAVIPGGRAARGAGKVARAEERALLKKAEKSLAVPGKQKASAPAEKPKVEKPKSLAVPGMKNAPTSGAKKPAVDFSEGFGTFKSGPTKVIWEDNKDGTIEVVSLRTPSAKRGQGAGRAAMQDFLAEADRQGLDVKLGASPLDKRTKLNKLVDFYKSLGFETTGKSINMAGEPEMIRRAQSVAPTGGKSLAAKPTGEKPAATAPSKPKTEKPFAAKTEGEKSLAVPSKQNEPRKAVISDVRDVGLGQQKYVTPEGAWLTVMENAKFAPRQHSVTDFVVPEELRGQGLGGALLDEVLAKYPLDSLSAAISSEPSVRAFYKRGFRPLGNPQGSLDDALAIMRDDSSVSMGVPRTPQGIIAYHGSPHSFDRFDISKIGTGEGAQAYGHGLYFAEAEDTARNYRNALARPEPGDMVGNAYDLVRILGEKDALENLKGINSKEAIATADAIISGAYKQYKPPGSMYQVRIKADPNQLLNWDQPIIAQSPEVQQAALLAAQNADISHLGSGHRARVKLERFMDAAEQAHDPLKGSELMMAVDRGPGNNFTPETSELLRAYGIPGVKYLDQASRTAGEGTRNYVVFDDALIDLLRRYAKGGIV